MSRPTDEDIRKRVRLAVIAALEVLPGTDELHSNEFRIWADCWLHEDCCTSTEAQLVEESCAVVGMSGAAHAARAAYLYLLDDLLGAACAAGDSILHSLIAAQNGNKVLQCLFNVI